MTKHFLFKFNMSMDSWQSTGSKSDQTLYHESFFLDSTSCAEAALMKMRAYCLERGEGRQNALDEVWLFFDDLLFLVDAFNSVR